MAAAEDFTAYVVSGAVGPEMAARGHIGETTPVDVSRVVGEVHDPKSVACWMPDAQTLGTQVRAHAPGVPATDPPAGTNILAGRTGLAELVGHAAGYLNAKRIAQEMASSSTSSDPQQATEVAARQLIEIRHYEDIRVEATSSSAFAANRALALVGPAEQTTADLREEGVVQWVNHGALTTYGSAFPIWP